MTTASKVRAIYTAPTATPQQTPIPNSKLAVAKAWLRKQLIRVVVHTIIALYWISVGSFIELKYHWLGTPAVQAKLANMQVKGGK
jgi:hypothetical protein